MTRETYEVSKATLRISLSGVDSRFDDPEADRDTNGINAVRNHEINISLGNEGVPVVGERSVGLCLTQFGGQTELVVDASGAVPTECVTSLLIS